MRSIPKWNGAILAVLCLALLATGFSGVQAQPLKTAIGDSVSIEKVNDGAEPSTNGKFRVMIDGPYFLDVTVYYTVGGTAAEGTDYASLSGSVTILAGSQTADVDIAVIDDSDLEVTETAELTLTGTDITAVSASGSASLDITDDETAGVTLEKVNDGAEPSTNGKFRMSIDKVPPYDVTVSYSVGGTAAEGTDYASLPGSVTISEGSTTADVDIVVTDDALLEETETVELTITGVDQPAVGAEASAALDITDDETALVSIDKVNDGAEPSTNGKFRANMDKTASYDVVVSYGIGGTAADGTDYAPLSGSVTIPAGDASADVDIVVTDDALLETTESVELTPTGTDHAAVSASTGGVVEITDDETASVSIAKINDGAEPSANGKFRVTMDEPYPTDVTVYYSTGGTADDGTDYAKITGWVTIPGSPGPLLKAGGTQKTAAILPSADVDIAVNDDTFLENTETVQLALTGTNQANVSADGYAALDITDDDTASVSIAKISDAAEPSTNGRFRLTLTKAAPYDVTVSTTAGGTAAEGTDYASLSGSVAIPTGSYTADVVITVTDDSDLEGTETVQLTLAGTDKSPVSASGNATLNLADNENSTFTVSGTITFSGSGLSGVQVNFSDGTWVTTDGTGTYSKTVNQGSALTVTPVKTGYAFSPVNASWADIQQNKTQDFTATVSTYTLSGTITAGGSPLAGVLVRFSDGTSTTTDGTGTYAKTVNPGASITIRPTKDGYAFSPLLKLWLNVRSNKVQDFTGTVSMHIISGFVTCDMAPVSGVTVTFSHDGHTETTNVLGFYFCIVPYGTSTTITPSKTGYGNWSPATRTLSGITQSHLLQNFTCEHDPVTVSGIITDESGDPMRDVPVGFIGGIAATTDGAGRYAKTLPYGASTFVEPSKPGYSFVPATLTKVKADTVLNFTGRVKNATIGDWVYHDENRDAGKNENEQGLGGITVALIGSLGDVSRTIETDSSGFYRFYDLDPGVYYISIDILDPDLPPEFVCTTRNHPKRVSVGLGEDYETANFGFAAREPQFGSIRFFTWHDANRNLKKDDDEGLLPLVDLWLYRLQGSQTAQEEVLVEAIKSDDYGYYQFNNLPAGDYVVRASPHGPDPSGIWVITTPAFNNVHLEAMQVYNDANFGYAHPGEGGRISTSVGGKQAMPAEFALHSNYPNPFNPSTTIRYDLPRAQRVILAVYDMLGREIRILVDHRQEAGSYEVRLDASGLPSGVYLVHFQTEEYRSMRRMTLTK